MGHLTCGSHAAWYLTAGAARPSAYSMEAIEKNVGGVASPLSCPREKVARLFHISGVVGCDALVQQLLRLPLAFGKRAPAALDVGPGPIMVTIKEDDARPDADRAFVSAREIVIQSRQQELLDASLTVGITRLAGRTDRFGRQRIRQNGAIIGQKPVLVNELQPWRSHVPLSTFGFSLCPGAIPNPRIFRYRLLRSMPSASAVLEMLPCWAERARRM